MTSVTVNPATARVGQTATCSAVASDADGDTPTLIYSWSNGVTGATFTLTAGNSNPDQVLTCTATARDPQSGTSSLESTQGVRVENSPPVITSVTILPANPTTTSTLSAQVVASDPDGGAPTIGYTWTVTRSGAQVGVYSTSTLASASANFLTGDVVSLLVEASDSQSTTSLAADTVTIGNTAPVVSSVTIFPGAGRVGQVLSCAAAASDADGDVPAITYAWFVASQNVGTGATFEMTAANTNPNQNVMCTATATDPQGATGSRSALALVENSPPIVTSVTVNPATARVGQTATCVATATDADGDIPTLTYSWSNGVTGATFTLTAGNSNPDQVLTCTATARDPQNATASLESTQGVRVENSPPVITSVTILPANLTTTSTLSAQVVASDPDGGSPTIGYTWTVTRSGVQVGVYSTSTLAIANFLTGDVVSLLVEASDSQSTTSLAASPVTIVNTAPTAPVIAVTPSSPQAGQSLTCTVTTSSMDPDGDAITYTYVWRRNGEQFSSETSSGLTSEVDGENVVAGETWTCRVVASDGRGGTSSAVERSVVVQGGAPSGFVLIPPSNPSFTQGPNTWTNTTISRTVTISRPFYLQATEVTQKQWRDLMGNNPSNFSSCGDDCPVEGVSWWDALAYMNALSADQNLQQCYDLSGCTGTPGTENYSCSSWTSSRFVGLSCTGYRLPTEAEWEYAARAGTTGARYGAIDDIAWYNGNSGGTTKVVGQKTPNAFGLYDMLGNVWEWTWDWYTPYTSASVTDPLGPDTGSDRVNRGGSWVSDAGGSVAAFRNRNVPSFRYYYLGFRPARSF